MSKKFRVIQDAFYCSNCGESDWIKNKKGQLCCVYCGHLMTNKSKQNQDNFKNNLQKVLDKRR